MPRTLSNFALVEADFAWFNPLHVIKIVSVLFVIAELNKRLSTKIDIYNFYNLSTQLLLH